MDFQCYEQFLLIYNFIISYIMYSCICIIRNYLSKTYLDILMSFNLSITDMDRCGQIYKIYYKMPAKTTKHKITLIAYIYKYV